MNQHSKSMAEPKMTYYCVRCLKDVEPADGRFLHPNLGVRYGKVCPVCWKPVMVKDNSDKDKVSA